MSVNTVFDVDATVQKLVLTDNIKEKETLAREIQAQAKAKGIFLASIHDVYMARGKGKGQEFYRSGHEFAFFNLLSGPGYFPCCQASECRCFYF